MLLALVVILLVPDRTYAHASLIEAIPAPNSTLAHSPSQITLHFNERVENELFYVHIRDQNGEPVTERDAALNLNQQKLYLELPSMKDGVYTVSYQVISSDGHPIKGVYTITIGDANSDHVFNMEQPSHLETITHGNIGSENTSIYMSRMLYMLSLLTVTGWVFWRNVNFEIINHLRDHRRHDVWGFILQGCLLVTLIVMVGFQSSAFMDMWNWDQLGVLLFKTTIGWTWLISISLSIAGFFLLFRYRWLDFGWVFLIYMAKSCNGHSMIFEPTLLTVPLNIIHLFAAAIWAGGLMYMIVHGRR